MPAAVGSTTAMRQPLERVERSWRGIVMDTYALEKLTGWTPELSPPPDSPLYPLARAGRGCLVRHSCFVVQSSLPRPSSFRDGHLAQARDYIPHICFVARWDSDVQLHIMLAADARSRNDGWTCLSVLAAHGRPRFAIILSLLEKEGAGKTGCALHPRSRVQIAHRKRAHEHTGSAETLRPSLRNGFTAYFVLSPVNGSFATVVSEKLASENLTPAPRRQDHTTSPYASGRLRLARLSRPSHPASRS